MGVQQEELIVQELVLGEDTLVALEGVLADPGPSFTQLLILTSHNFTKIYGDVKGRVAMGLI